MGRLDIYFGGGEMNWGIWEKVEGCGYGGNGLFMGEVDWGNSFQQWGYGCNLRKS